MGKLYIIDNNASSLIGDLQIVNDDTVIQSKAELDVFSPSEFEFDSVVILCELNWEGKYLQDFYGFELATELRRKYQLLCPIILTSSLKQPFFEKKAEGNIYFNILFGRGTGFLELNKLEEKLNSSIDELQEYPMSKEALIDMNEMLLSQRFIIDKLTHDLKPGISAKKIDEVFDEAAKYLDKHQLGEIASEAARIQLKDKLENPNAFNKEKEELIARCEKEIVDTEDTTVTAQKKRHSLIVLEDDPDFRRQIDDELSNHFENIFQSGNATKVIEELKKDENNNYIGIVTDWRLYDYDKEPKTRYWQKLQGYEVLKEASKDRFIALFSLTSEIEKNVHKIQNELGLDIHLFKKQHLINDGWDVMANTIMQKCDEVAELIGSEPTGATWGGLKGEYISKRSHSWNNFENEISKEATLLFNYYYNAIFHKEEGEERLLESISAKGFTLKNNLRNVLIVRRVYLGIYFSLIDKQKYLQHVGRHILNPNPEKKSVNTELRHHYIDTHSILKSDWWEDLAIDELNWSNFDQRMKNLRSSLCIELSELPQEGLLPEEKRWLKKNEIYF